MKSKHQAFINEFLKDRNATQAAIRAGYSPKSAAVQGCELLKNPKISEVVAERTAKAGMTADEILQGLADIAKATGDDKVKTSDRVAALIALGKGHRLFTDKVEVSGSVTLAELVPRAAAEE